MIPLPPRSTLFPYTTLFRSVTVLVSDSMPHLLSLVRQPVAKHDLTNRFCDVLRQILAETICKIVLDRKSTRLNSSHTVISYAVFCLKKKNVDQQYTQREGPR